MMGVVPENGIELCVKTTDSHFGKVPIRVDDLCSLNFSLGFPSQVQTTSLHLLKANPSVDEKKTTGHFMRHNFFSSLKCSQVGCLTVLQRHSDINKFIRLLRNCAHF